MPATSLRQLATATAIKHVKMLDDIGNLPYALARPILLKVDNPEKLHQMELKSPHLLEDDQELWIEFIKRDIPQWETLHLPRQSNRWYELYCELREEVQRSLDADAEKLKMAIDGIQSEKARLTPKIISRPHGKSRPRPRPVYNPYERSMGGGGGGSSATSERLGSSSLTFGSSRPSGFGVSKASAPKKSIFAPQRRNNALAVPTKHLSTRASRVQQAPRSLIEEHRRPVDPPTAPTATPSTSRTGRGTGGILTQSNSRSQAQSTPVSSNPAFSSKSAALAEREARLQAIASGKPLPSQKNSGGSNQSSATQSTSNQSTSKRRANSPLAEEFTSMVNSQAQTSDSSAPPRPAVVRKRPDSVFIQPKRRRGG